MLAAIPAMVLALIAWLIQTFMRNGNLIFPPEIIRTFRQAEVTLVKWEMVADALITFWWVPLVLFALWFFRSRQS